MEDKDTTLRRVALQQAITHLSAKTIGSIAAPDDVTNVAKIFYTFLKGETK